MSNDPLYTAIVSILSEGLEEGTPIDLAEAKDLIGIDVEIEIPETEQRAFESTLKESHNLQLVEFIDGGVTILGRVEALREYLTQSDFGKTLPDDTRTELYPELFEAISVATQAIELTEANFDKKELDEAYQLVSWLGAPEYEALLMKMGKTMQELADDSDDPAHGKVASLLIKASKEMKKRGSN